MDPHAPLRPYRSRTQRQRRSYFRRWRDETFTCPCDWSGPGRALIADLAVYEARLDYRCPACADSIILAISLPYPGEISSAGPPHDEEALSYRARFIDRLTAEGFTARGDGGVKPIGYWSTSTSGLHLERIVPPRYPGYFQVRYAETVAADSAEAAIAAVEATYVQSDIKQRLDPQGESPQRPIPFPGADAAVEEWNAWLDADGAQAQAGRTSLEWAATGGSRSTAGLAPFGIIPLSTSVPNPHLPWSATVRIDELIQALREYGGFTLEVHGGHHPASGYAVGYTEGSLSVPTVEFFEPSIGQEIIIDYVECGSALHVGGWHNRSDDTVVLMRVDVIADWAMAVTTGIERDQIAIYDLENHEEILLPRPPSQLRGVAG